MAGTLLADTRLLRRVLVWGLAIGLPANVALAWIMASPGDFPPGPAGMKRTVAYALGVVPLALAYAAGFVLLWRREAWRRVIGVASPVGRMALTNYLAQSLMGIGVFYGHRARVGDARRAGRVDDPRARALRRADRGERVVASPIPLRPGGMALAPPHLRPAPPHARRGTAAAGACLNRLFERPRHACTPKMPPPSWPGRLCVCLPPRARAPLPTAQSPRHAGCARPAGTAGQRGENAGLSARRGAGRCGHRRRAGRRARGKGPARGRACRARASSRPARHGRCAGARTCARGHRRAPRRAGRERTP